MTKHTFEDLQAALQTFGTKQAAADALGISRSTFRVKYDKFRARRGLMGTAPVLPGFAIARTTVKKDQDGTVQAEWITQKPEPSPAEFEVPAGHVIKGVSALVEGGSGRVLSQWVKTREDGTDRALAAIRTAFDDYRGAAPLIDPPAHTDADLLTVYNVADHHLGMFSWARETGEAYDLKEGERVLREAMASLVSMAPQSAVAVILNLGDFFHADNGQNRTERSGHSLDVDTRYAKVLSVGVRLMIDCIDLAAQKHDSLIVRCLPGNHDPHTALALTVALSAFYDANPRITVDTDPGLFWFYRFGRTMLGATHGHMVKPSQLPGVMASYRPQDWGASVYRYAYLGHVHHSSKGGEAQGCQWETFQTLAAKDAWHHGSGYASKRTMTAITHHRDHGETYRHTVCATLPHP